MEAFREEKAREAVANLPHMEAATRYINKLDFRIFVEKPEGRLHLASNQTYQV